MNSARTWEMYRAAFKEGDEVVIIDVSDNFFWGKLETHEDHCILHRLLDRPQKVLWDDVMVIAHDGFPVRRVRENSRAAAALEQMDIDDVTEKVQQLLTIDVCDKCGGKIFVERLNETEVKVDGI